MRPGHPLHSRRAEADPAQALLAQRICDPAMGSGHFLVSLVDELADRLLEQLAHAEAEAIAAGIAHYRSPVSREIAHLRERILARAQDARCSVDPALLDVRPLVRPMILNRVVYGRSESRTVGQEDFRTGRSRRSPYHKKKNTPKPFTTNEYNP